MNKTIDYNQLVRKYENLGFQAQAIIQAINQSGGNEARIMDILFAMK